MENKTYKFLMILGLSLIGIFLTESPAKANYWLVIGTYRQAPGSRPEVSGITSPSLQAIPMKSLELCNKAGKKISEEIYKPVWQFDNRWTCIYTGLEN